MEIEQWKKRIKKYQDYKYDAHFPIRLVQRRLSFNEVIKHIKDPSLLINVQSYGKKGHRLFFKESSKFTLIIGVEFHSKLLYMKTVFRRNRKWQKKI